jgi:hypothetical protein
VSNVNSADAALFSPGVTLTKVAPGKRNVAADVPPRMISAPGVSPVACSDWATESAAPSGLRTIVVGPGRTCTLQPTGCSIVNPDRCRNVVHSIRVTPR